MNVVIWFQSPNVKMLVYAINVLNKQCGNVVILGMTGAQRAASVSSGPFEFIDKNDLPKLDYDLLLVSGEDASMVDVFKEAPALGIDPDKVILDRTICINNFSLERYQRLRKSRLSILSRNCWGGFMYYRLGLPFLSPTINMFLSDRDFIKLIRDRQHYFSQELRLVDKGFNPTLEFEYPIFMLDDVKLNMNHYRDVDDAREKWRSRSARINWSNALILMDTNKPELLAEFDQLPFDKKICFVPFETDIESGFYIPPEQYCGQALWQAVLDTARGDFICFDLWDMLLYGKKTPL